MKTFTLVTLLAGLSLASPVPDVDQNAPVEKRYGNGRVQSGKEYWIVSVAEPSIVIDLSGSEPTGPIIGYNNNTGDNQKWTARALGFGGVFGFQNAATQTWLSAPDDGSDQLVGSPLVPFGNPSGRWTLQRQSSGSYVIRSTSDPGKVIDLSGASSDPLTPVIVYPYNGGTNQEWKFVPVDSDDHDSDKHGSDDKGSNKGDSDGQDSDDSD